MENKVMIKEVDFNGAMLMAVKSNETGKIHVGVSYICNGIGFSKSQKDTQVQKIQNDILLKRGCLKFQAGVLDENNEAWAIELDYLPLWLAKITVTPTIQSETPELADKLIEYQLKAKDVLAKAFINNDSSLQNYLDLSEEDRAIEYFKKAKEIRLLKEQEAVNAPKINYHDNVLNPTNENFIKMSTMTDIAKDIGMTANKLNTHLHDLGVIYKKNKTWALYAEHQNKVPDLFDYHINQFGQTLKVKEKGRKWIIELLQDNDIIARQF